MIGRVTKGGKVPMLFLENEDGTVVVKVYPNESGTKVRIILPELTDPAQCQGETSGPLRGFTFTRKP